MRDIIDKLVGRFGAGPEPAATPGLTEADRRAIRDDLALFTPLDAELATGLARYVLSGTDESALLRLKAVPIQEALRAYFGHQWRDAEVRNRQRAAVFLKLQGWDAAAIKRYGEVLSPLALAGGVQRSTTPERRIGHCGCRASSSWWTAFATGPAPT